MVDDLIGCMDRVIASACFPSGNVSLIAGRVGWDGRMGVGLALAVPVVGRDEGGGGEEGCSEKFIISSGKKRVEKKRSKEQMIECKICQEEGEEGDMEAPCACSGTIKFAHRKCVERWCNKKGNIICEICNQAYAPNYSVPRKDCMTIDIRQGWGPQIDLDAPHFFAIAAAEQQLLHVEYDDFSVSNTSGVLCCRYMAFMLLLLLIIRQALMLTGESGTLRNLSILVNISVLQFSGFLLLFYLIGRSFYMFQCRRRWQH